MNKNPFLNALYAALYIGGIVLLISQFTDGAKESIFIPMTMLSLFVLSAAIMGFFFISRPLQLYMDGSKDEAVKFFLKTIGSFAIFAGVYATLLFVQNGNTKIGLSEEVIYINSSEDLIVVELPFPGAVTGKAFSVIGKARGNWFFEASFPIEVLDKNGKSLAVGIAQAQSEWMTTEFVPFKANIKVPDNYIGPATLVLKKDNPSGLSEYDASVSFPFNIEY